MVKDNFAKSSIVAPEVLQKLSIVPRLASRYGKGFTLLDADKIRYFPLGDVPQIPARFAQAVATYDESCELILINDRNLSTCSWMLVRIEQQQTTARRGPSGSKVA